MGSQTPIPPKQTDHPNWSSACAALHQRTPVPVSTNLVLRVIDMDATRVEVEAGMAFQIGDKIQVLKHRGEAVLDPGDVFDAQIGVRLAAGRALTALGARLERQAGGMIRQAEDVAASKLIAAAAQEKRTERGLLRAKSKKVVNDIIDLATEQQERPKRRFGRRRKTTTG